MEIHGYSLMEIHWYSVMVSNNEYQWISSSLKSSSLKKQWNNYKKLWKIMKKSWGTTENHWETAPPVYQAAFRQPGDSALASNLGFCRPLPRPPRKSKIHGVGNPWGGKSLEIHEQIQDFWKPRFHQKVKVWKQVGRFSQCFKSFLVRSSNSVALTFRGGFE